MINFVMVGRVVMGEAEWDEDHGEHEEDVGLDGSNKEFEGHEGWQGEGSEVGGEEADHHEEHFTSEDIAKKT